MTTEVRPDVDIEDDIHRLIGTFAPLKASRSYFDFRSEGGKITLHGNVRSPQAKRVLLDNVPRVAGVADHDASDLFDDEEVKFSVAQLLPPGVYANVHYGAVTLTGTLPEGANADAIAKEIGNLPGVRRVALDLSP
ncbi:MAG: BON domain-containing protein [Anaerolineae bacterium]|nr:BON domain-containing protein [Anaerolineae bacterium]